MAVDRFFSGFSDKDERFRVLSSVEERELIERLKDDRAELEHQLVAHNIFLAIGFASKQQYRFRDFDELIALSMYGLMDAAKTFDTTKGFRFNTYAVWYLKKHVLRRFHVRKEYEIANNTAIFLDEPRQQNGEENECDFMYGTLCSQLNPDIEERYSIPTASEEMEREERGAYMKEMLNKVVESVATSSLSDTDKRIFSMTYLEGDNISTISHELGISSAEVSKGRKRVLTFINENFSKEEIFAA